MTKKKTTTAGPTSPAVTLKKTETVAAPEAKTLVDETPEVKTLDAETPEAKTAAEEAAAAAALEVTDEETVEPYFEHGNSKYTLAHYVQKLQVDGVIYPREKLLINEAIMTTLIVGNSPFVIKL